MCFPTARIRTRSYNGRSITNYHQQGALSSLGETQTPPSERSSKPRSVTRFDRFHESSARNARYVQAELEAICVRLFESYSSRGVCF
jgi:hypothetical protein